MLIKYFTLPASKIFRVKNVLNSDDIYSEIPYLSFSYEIEAQEEESVFFQDENKKGYGIYTITYNHNKNTPILAYIGSYCGENDVVKVRWLPHMATLTSRSCKTNFKSFKKSDKFDNLTLSDLLKNKETYKKYLQEIIENKKELIRKDIETLKIRNSAYFSDVLDKVLKIGLANNNQTLKNLLGEGNSISKERIKFVSKHWDFFKNKTNKNILEDFTFTYFKISKFLDFNLPPLKIREKRSNTVKGSKDLILENLCEFYLIKKYKPLANKPKTPKDSYYLFKNIPNNLKQLCITELENINRHLETKKEFK
tara:strand:+ start:419 stop:1348 length:930 start_codon:yes stop_codon:yes gene_type:complete